jgi:hypothetical protein
MMCSPQSLSMTLDTFRRALIVSKCTSCHLLWRSEEAGYGGLVSRRGRAGDVALGKG